MRLIVLEDSTPFDRVVGTVRAIFVLSLSVAAFAQATSTTLTLAANGRSGYTIVVAPQAPPAVSRAAQELQRFLAEMSGVRLPIVTNGQPVKGNQIIVGTASPPASLGSEDFLLTTITPGNHLLIAGGGPRGTLYGVYTLLDRLGCRWFTREVSRIPKRSTITLPAPVNETHRPAFEYREPFFTEAWDKDWAARNRTNGDHTQLDASTGGKVQYHPFVHSFYELLPPEKHFAAHPEYYSLIDGKRRVDRGQLCLTNKEVLRLAIEQVEAWIRDHPDATIFSVSQNDWEGWCECDRCRRVEEEEGGAHSGPVLRFVNAVAEEIGKRHPGKLIDTLAYWYTEDPPAKVRPAPNVRIRLCPIGICVAHSFATCPRSAYFYRNLAAWSKITNQLYIWHYNTNFSHYSLPFPDFDELAADIPLYKQHGVVGLFLQGAYAPGGGGENSELRAYVLARLLWDPKTNVSRTVDEFLEGVYGAAAAPHMRRYYELLHREVRNPGGGRHLWIFNVPDYSPSFLPEAKEAFARAEARAPDDGAKRRLRKARLAVDYYDFLRRSNYEFHDGVYGPTALDSLVAAGKQLFATMRGFGIESLHEGQPIDRDEERLTALKNLPAIHLANGTWQADIVPDLNARVVRLTTGVVELLRQYPPGESGAPNAGGQTATAHSGYHDRPWQLQWAVENSTARTVILTADANNGVKLRRTLSLTSNGLHTALTAANASSGPLTVALQMRMEFAAPDGTIDQAITEFTRASGEPIRRKLLANGAPPAGHENWTGPELPAGQWTLLLSPAAANTAAFPAPPNMARGYMEWTAKSRPGVAFGLWSNEEVLQPGKSLHIEADYGRR